MLGIVQRSQSLVVMSCCVTERSWYLPLCCCSLWLLLLLTGGGAGGRLASLLWWWWLLLLSLSLLEFWLLTSAEDTPIPVPALRPTLAQPCHAQTHTHGQNKHQRQQLINITHRAEINPHTNQILVHQLWSL